MNNGAAEGRQGSIYFIAQQYLAMYSSEGNAGDWVGATREYVANGHGAGLAGRFALRSEVFSIPNYLYYNPDLRGAFGGNRAAIVKHWLNTGINEGRRASDIFSAPNYLARYPDIAARTGGNYNNAIRNFILSGLENGLIGN